MTTVTHKSEGLNSAICEELPIRAAISPTVITGCSNAKNSGDAIPI